MCIQAYNLSSLDKNHVLLIVFVTDQMLKSIKSCHSQHACSQLARCAVNTRNNSHVAECTMKIWYSYVTTFCVTSYTLLQSCDLVIFMNIFLLFTKIYHNGISTQQNMFLLQNSTIFCKNFLIQGTLNVLS